MQVSRALEQSIAVFGESGSGKTVMLSSFYGATQEASFLKSSYYNVTANDTGQGHRLFRNYLGMRDSARRPEPNKFAATSYAFSIKIRDKDAAPSKSKAFDSLKLIWHDYPGEWFEQDVTSAEEAQRRIDTFRSLLGSDVAILLIDGQRMLDNAGEEERYLKALFGSFRTGLLGLKDELLIDGQKLVCFPRIWILALSKADLLPHLDSFKLRDLIVDKASEDLDQLREVLKGFVEEPEAFAIGEDFLMLSSAKFEASKIEVAERIGIDLILPVAAILPFERHAQWAKERRAGGKVLEELLSNADEFAKVLIRRSKDGGAKEFFLGLLARDVVAPAAELAGELLRKRNEDALARRDYLAAVLTGFRMSLEEGEEKGHLLKSRR